MCYSIPLTAAIIITAVKKNQKTKNLYFNWLKLMLWGGTIMLVLDHLWNGEIFLIGPNITKDLLLGVAMTGLVFLTWGIMVLIQRIKIIKTTQI